MSDSNPQTDAESEWCVVELLGRCVMAGMISEIEMFGGLMAHLLTPYPDGRGVVRLFNRSNIYKLTLCDEATARRVIEVGYLPSCGDFTSEDGYFDDDDAIQI